MTLLRRLSAISSRYFLLESVEGGENLGQVFLSGIQSDLAGDMQKTKR